jgi:hypothetical protein
MSFILRMSGVIVGRSELETRDATRNVARGAFRPGLGYELAEPVFMLLDQAGGDADALSRYRKALEALRLELEDSSGSSIAVRDLHIRRAAHAYTGAPVLTLEVDTVDPLIWTASTELPSAG